MRAKTIFFIMVMLVVMPPKRALADANDAYDNAKETEQSFANRMLGGASTAATGMGAMQLAEGVAEQNADKEADAEMRAYIETIKCEYGDGQQVILGNEEITLPGGNELLTYYNEYREIAERLKQTKTALGMRTGIESEVLYDRAQSGLYQYSSFGKTGGGETSLYRALTDETGKDAAAWTAQQEENAKKIKTGAIVAGAGIAAGVIGNSLINKESDKKSNQKKQSTKSVRKAGQDCSATLRSTTHIKSARYDENGNCVLVCKKDYEKTDDNLQCVPTEEKALATANKESRRNIRNQNLSQGVVDVVKTGIKVSGDTANVAITGVGAVLDPAAAGAMANASGEVAAGKYSDK